MNFETTIKNWLGQSTTGQGFTVLIGVFLSYLTHEMTPAVAIVAAASALVLIFWPQKHGTAADVGIVAGDGEKLLAAFQAGVAHGQSTAVALRGALATPGLAQQVITDASKLATDARTEGGGTAATGIAAVAVAPGAPAASATGPVAAALGVLALIVVSIGLSACATPAQTGATLAGIVGAYNAAGTAEIAASKGQVPGVALSAADIATYKQLDNVAYPLVSTLVANHTKGIDPSGQQLTDTQAAVNALVSFLVTKGVSPK